VKVNRFERAEVDFGTLATFAIRALHGSVSSNPATRGAEIHVHDVPPLVVARIVTPAPLDGTCVLPAVTATLTRTPAAAAATAESTTMPNAITAIETSRFMTVDPC
jgi:hypothetical protein